jgi:hypothetical protein
MAFREWREKECGISSFDGAPAAETMPAFGTGDPTITEGEASPGPWNPRRFSRKEVSGKGGKESRTGARAGAR